MQESLNKLREAAKDKDKEIELLYFDETGIANVPNVQRSWSPLGEPHSADASIARKRVNVLGALNSRVRQQTAIFRGFLTPVHCKSTT